MSKQVYVIGTAAFTYFFIVRYPTRLSTAENIVGSVFVSLLTGWFLWPLIAFHAYQTRNDKEDQA